MTKLFILVLLFSVSAMATCWQGFETTCFLDKKKDLKMTYRIGGCSPPGGPVSYFSEMKVSALSNPNIFISAQKPEAIHGKISTLSLIGNIPMKTIESKNSLLIIEQIDSQIFLTLKSDLYPELDTEIKSELKEYKCSSVKLKWGRNSDLRRDRDILIQ